MQRTAEVRVRKGKGKGLAACAGAASPSFAFATPTRHGNGHARVQCAPYYACRNGMPSRQAPEPPPRRHTRAHARGAPRGPRWRWSLACCTAKRAASNAYTRQNMFHIYDNYTMAARSSRINCRRSLQEVAAGRLITHTRRPQQDLRRGQSRW